MSEQGSDPVEPGETGNDTQQEREGDAEQVRKNHERDREAERAEEERTEAAPKTDDGLGDGEDG